MTALTWPERPACHDNDPMSVRFGPTSWRPARGDDGGPYAETFRTCSYCGCIHPEDLLAALRAGARLERAGMKYGWPHKLYVENMPNPKAGEQCRVGSRHNGAGEPEPIMGAAPTYVYAKFYTQHLTDLSPEALVELAKLIKDQTGITFERDERGVKYAVGMAEA